MNSLHSELHIEPLKVKFLTDSISNSTKVYQIPRNNSKGNGFLASWLFQTVSGGWIASLTFWLWLLVNAHPEIQW